MENFTGYSDGFGGFADNQYQSKAKSKLQITLAKWIHP